MKPKKILNPKTNHMVLRDGKIGEQILKGTQKSQEDDWDRMYKHFQRRVNKKIKGSKYVVYSAYKSDKNDVPIDNLDKVAIRGKVRFHAKHDPFWGRGKDYVSRVVTNPTWLDVAVCK